MLEASNMDVTDSRFVGIDGTMSEINDNLEAGMYEKCFLQKLSHVDEMMESLRREVLIQQTIVECFFEIKPSRET